MQIKFKHIRINNFCGIKQLDTPLYGRTSIKGRNAVGKSTIRNAIFWILYNKLADGSAPDGIRPHDENGVDIDFIDICVVLTIDVDGREIELKKTQKQKWTKPHGQQEKRFDGNINEFEINGIPKKEKDYTSYIEENIAPMETLMYCTNAMVFLGLDNKKRRAKLLSLEKEFSDADVVATDKKYEPLTDMLKDGTVDELIARSKKVIRTKNDELKTIPARIDELKKQKVDIDAAELELGRNALKEQIAENKAKQEDISKQYEEYQKLSDGIMELKFEESDLQRKANEESNRKRREIEERIADKEFLIKRTKDTIRDTERDIAETQKKISLYANKLEQLRSDYKTVYERVFDENSLVCSFCGQKFQTEKQERLKADFESHKEQELQDITDEGNSVKQLLDEEKEALRTLGLELSEHKESLEMLNRSIEELKKELSDMPEKVTDIFDTEEYKAIQKQITEKEAAMLQGNNADEIRQILKEEAEELQSQLTEIERQIAKSENNVRLDERISELHAEQREISQKVADEERTLDLLEDFNRAKINLLTDRVNRHFELVKWQMFKPQINGGFAEVCIPTIGGTSYDGLLNNGNKILAEIDICKAFQRVNDVVCPIMADNAESVDSWRIPKTDSQMLLFMRTDDKELTIEEAR